MPKTWEAALDSYRYDVNLTNFKDRAAYRGWFQLENSPLTGDYAETKEFERRFRELAPYNLETWYEVAYWKDPRKARRVICNIKRTVSNPGELLSLCQNYINNPSRESLSNFSEKLAPSGTIATAATFPAFLNPSRFPMVDRQVAEWARYNRENHDYSLVGGPRLWEPRNREGVLFLRHWRFIESWCEWCRHTATILTERSNRKWRARDVEMAVFTAQRSQGSKDPITLNALHP